jgi:drug/metabolite transporter (DMT)-like permease
MRQRAAVAFLLALLSGLLHAGWNALAKRLAPARLATATILFVALLVGASVSVGVGIEGTAPWAAWPWLLLSGLGEAAYVVCLGQAYQHGDLALTYTVSRATAQAAIWPFSWLAFSTVPTSVALLATLLVAVGIMVTRQPKAQAQWHPGWTIATGVCVGLYHTGYKGQVAAGVAPAHAFTAALVVAVPLVFLRLGPQGAELRELLRQWRTWVAGALCATSFLLMVWALSLSESGRVLGVRNASVGFALMFAVIGGERLTRRTWFGLCVLLIGVALFSIR